MATPPIVRHLVVEHGVAVREGATLNVLAGEADVDAVGEQRAERHGLRGCEVDAGAGGDRVLALLEDALERAVQREALGDLGPGRIVASRHRSLHVIYQIYDIEIPSLLSIRYLSGVSSLKRQCDRALRDLASRRADLPELRRREARGRLRRGLRALLEALPAALQPARVLVWGRPGNDC
jgi:hypothetical protein